MKNLTFPQKNTFRHVTLYRSQGFTLIEMLLTLVIVGILLAAGAPTMTDTIKNSRMVSQTNGTIGMLAYARSEAAKRPGTNITFCASTTAHTPSPSCNSNNWEDGWFMMTDLDGDQTLDTVNEDLNGDDILDPGEDLNGNGELDYATDELIRVGESLSGGNTMRTVGFPSQGFVQFDSDGEPNSSGTFVLCDSRGVKEAKAIVISIIGQVRKAVDEEDPRDEIVNDHAGVNITCPAS